MKRQLSVLAAAALFAALAGQSAAAPNATRSARDISSLKLSAPVQGSRKVDSALLGAQGEVDVVVQLSGLPLVAVNGENARRIGGLLNKSQQRAHSAGLRRDQDAMLARLLSLGGRELGRVRIAYNAVIVRIDAAQLYTIAEYANVLSVRGVGNYEMDLSDTVPYIGAAIAQAAGANGFGITVAVLDSGIDYTHRNLGGAGTDAAYAAAYGVSTDDPLNTTRDGLFPTSKVIAGFDFVGESWPNTATALDDDPIDLEGHGTHVADIIAGESLDGLHKGVAPKAKLISAKVCSAVATSCNGVALLQGIDFALDPNGDGCMEDAADVINMSLGSSYGQVQDDLSFASTNAVKAGVVVVASAGNSADRPFITGSPASSPDVLSVAQTQVPGAKAYPLTINGPAAIAGVYTNTEVVDWAPLSGVTSGEVVFVGRGCVGDAYLADPAGKIALIDRGTCNISEKTALATEAGATGVLLGLIAPGDAVTFSNGGQCPTANGPCIPTMIIIQSYANLIKAQLNAGAVVTATISDSVFVSLAGSMVGSSSRGPNYSFAAIKPEIGAPGASVSAVAGTGTGEEAFGGTSGAAPMVAGAAAAVLSAHPKYTPTQVKALLANTGETTIYNNPATQPGVLAPITRIGGGEVRVDRAIAARTAMWDARTRAPALSFGYLTASYPKSLTRSVRVRNFSLENRTYSVATSFRFADDAASGAVTVSAPATVSVGPRSATNFDVTITIDPTLLNDWPWYGNGGSQGGNGALLQSVEYDGYITLSDDGDTVHMPWHVLPKKAALVQAVGNSVTIKKGQTTALLPFANLTDATTGTVEPFALVGTSPRIPKSDLPGPGDNFAVVDLQAAGVRLAGDPANPGFIQFGISTYGTRAHPAYPAEFDVVIDTTGDGVPDYVVYTQEQGTFASTGQTLVYVYKFGAAAANAYFYADNDLESGNMILTAPLGALGITAGTKLGISVETYDNYFTGAFTDSIDGIVYTPNAPRFDVAGVDLVAPLSVVNATVTAFPLNDLASPSQSGLLFLYRDANKGLEADAIKVKVKGQP